MMSFDIAKTELFEKWFSAQAVKIQMQIDGRLLRITENGYFGHIRKLDTRLSELKFNNGNRIYYTVKDNKLVVLLAGGNKNSQAKDIKLAKKLAREVYEQS